MDGLRLVCLDCISPASQHFSDAGSVKDRWIDMTSLAPRQSWPSLISVFLTLHSLLDCNRLAGMCLAIAWLKWTERHRGYKLGYSLYRLNHVGIPFCAPLFDIDVGRFVRRRGERDNDQARHFVQLVNLRQSFLRKIRGQYRDAVAQVSEFGRILRD
jgi:hypothetical protein